MSFRERVADQRGVAVARESEAAREFAFSFARAPFGDAFGRDVQRALLAPGAAAAHEDPNTFACACQLSRADERRVAVRRDRRAEAEASLGAHRAGDLFLLHERVCERTR